MTRLNIGSAAQAAENNAVTDRSRQRPFTGSGPSRHTASVIPAVPRGIPEDMLKQPSFPKMPGERIFKIKVFEF
jgi:hypothetical protein